MGQEPGTHAGHRQRMRQRFFATGLQGFHPHEMLELLLFSAIPKRDVNPLAHELIRRFGSVDGVLSASKEELMQVNGVGPRVAELLAAVNEITLRYEATRNLSRRPLSSVEQAAEYARPLFHAAVSTELALLLEDGKSSLLAADVFPWQAKNPSCIRAALSLALSVGAHSAALMISHRGPARRPGKSELEDIARLVSALSAVDVYTIDCVLLSGNRLFSLRREGLLSDETTSLRDASPQFTHWLDPLYAREGRNGWFQIGQE